MHAWRETKLGEVIEVKHGFAFKGEHFSDHGDLILLTPGNFKEEGGLKLKGEKEKFYAGDFPTEYLLRKGDLLVAMTDLTQNAPILGSPAFVPEDDRFLHNQRLGKIVVRRPDQVDAGFIFYLLNLPSVRGHIKGSASGATVRHTSPSRIYDVPVRIPSLSVQRRIAETLSNYDDLIENNQRRTRILEEMARALYREWFVEFRFPGHASVPRVGKIPQRWVTVQFTDIADVLSGGTPKTDIPEYWNGEIPFFTPRDAPEYFYVLDTAKHVTELGLSKSASELYPSDTVFITARGTVGKVALPSVPMAMNQSCYALRGKPGIPQRFLFLMMLDRVDFLRTNTGGATFATIVVDTFRRMQVVKPRSEVVESFRRVIDPMFEQINALQRQVGNLRAARDLLLPRLLSGAQQLRARLAINDAV